VSGHFHNAPFPRAPLIGAATLVLVALLATTWVRLTGVGAARVPDAAPVATRDLRFEDRPDGAIAVYDADRNSLVDVVTGANGFMRGTLRGLARERKRSGLGPEPPFVLTAREDGRLTLEDPSTGRRVDLESFGPTNEAVFARLLDLRVPPR
jgi:putative photosynthetic complex assembly protein